MENFFSWMTNPLPDDEVEVWLNMNNIIHEKTELFYDFCISLITLMKETYLGEELSSPETRITMSDEEKDNHFLWCWKKTLQSFEKENIFFNYEGEHKEYFHSFFLEIFYNQKNTSVRNSIEKFINDLFNRDEPFTKSDLELFTEVYKLLDKNIINKT